MTSVIVPAHNEERWIGACLSALLRGAQDGEFEIVVVCNGCTDRTAEIARSFGEAVTVVETPVASKVNALSIGDRIVAGFPRLYVDGDVILDTSSARALMTALDEPGVLAVSPRPSYRVQHSGRLVRSYHRIWVRLPGVRAGLVGAGVYGLSEEGRRRLGSFPDVLGDDYFVQQRFASHERRVVDDAISQVEPSRSVGDLIDRKVRVFVGNREVADRYRGGEATTRWTGCLQVVRERPGLVADLPAFTAVSVLAKSIAWWRYRRGTWRSWTGNARGSGQLSLLMTGRDSQSREHEPSGSHATVLDGSNDKQRERTS